MKYVLLICDDEVAAPTDEALEADPIHQAWSTDLERRGVREYGLRLRPVDAATTVRVRDGETLVSDGPFAETKDVVGGVVVVECADLDEAIAITEQRSARRIRSGSGSVLRDPLALCHLIRPRGHMR